MNRIELEKNAISAVHYVLLFFDFRIPAGESAYSYKQILLRDKFTVDIALFGFKYMIEWRHIVTADEPIIYVNMTKTVPNKDIWESAYMIKQDGMMCIGAHKSFPAMGETWIRKPWILHFSDILSFGMYIDNITGTTFEKDIRFHFTMYYKELV